MRKFFVAAATLVLLASPVRSDDALAAKMKAAGLIVGGLYSCGAKDRAKRITVEMGKESRAGTKSKEEYQAVRAAFLDSLKSAMRPREHMTKETCDKVKKLADNAGF